MLMRSSVLPVARSTLEAESEGGESARQRIAEVCALKRKVSLKSTLGCCFRSVMESGAEVPVVSDGGMVAVKPCRTRS